MIIGNDFGEGGQERMQDYIYNNNQTLERNDGNQ
jgi:hypothetical protein